MLWILALVHNRSTVVKATDIPSISSYAFVYLVYGKFVAQIFLGNFLSSLQTLVYFVFRRVGNEFGK
jgi:hypothetical protein